MEHEHFKRVVEYVAMQCTGCSDSPMILAFKAYEVMKKAVDNDENPDMEFTPYIDYYNEEIEPDWTESFTREWKGIAVDDLGEYLDDYAVSGSTISQVVGEDMSNNLFSIRALNVISKK